MWSNIAALWAEMPLFQYAGTLLVVGAAVVLAKLL